MQRNNDNIIDIKKRIENGINYISTINNVVPNTLKRTANFKGRKSVEISEKIISAIAKPNAIIGDPFTGMNSFGIASRNGGFQFKGAELDNYTFSVLKALFTQYDANKFKDMFNQIKEKYMHEIMDLYATECCGQKNYISKLHFDPEGEEGFDFPEYYHPTPHRDIANNETIILSAACPICGRKKKKFDKIDETKILECNKLDTSAFPNHHLIENSRINITATHAADRYDRNFTNRSKYALLRIQWAINELEASTERDILEQCLVASLTLARICQYGSGSEYIYQVMRKQAQEKNVWELFNDKVESFSIFKEEYTAYQYPDISSNNCPMQIVNSDYKLFLDNNPNVFDVLYTDPPYTDQVAYLERSQLYRDWLHAFYDPTNSFLLTEEMLNDEIVVTNAPSRLNKAGLVQYYADIDTMFGKFYDSLKDNGIVVMTIKLGSKKYLLTLAEYIKLARKNGFEFIEKYCIDKNDPTIRKQAARKNTMAKEMLIFFVKLSNEDRYWYYNDIDMEFEITKFIYNEIKHSENGSLLLSECISKCQNYIRQAYNILSNEDLLSKINKVILDNFYLANTSFVYIDPNKLYLDVEDTTDLFAKLYDIIPVIIKNFDSQKGFSLEDLYFEIINTLFNGNNNALNQIIETADHESEIRVLLDNYCTMNHDEKYFLKKYSYSENSESTDISSMDAYEFEDLVKELFIKKGYYDVTRIGGAGDRGVDIMAKKKIDGVEHGYIIQCKRWIGNVGGTPIQRLHSMMIQMAPVINHAICVTTSNYTSDAIRESKNTNVELINGQELIEELNRVFPGKYHHAALNLI